MKNRLFFMLLAALLALSGCGRQELPVTSTPTETTEPTVLSCTDHTDADDSGTCDLCGENVIVTVDFYAINDLHGKVADGDNHPGVDELTTYLKDARRTDDHVILLSVGDMWQGSPESNLTGGLLTTEWMNELDFDAMTLGNHEYDWGESFIRDNADTAEFPFLAINIYRRDTDTLVPYCTPSVLLDRGGIQIGVIGAMGDCYSSIASEKTEEVYFKVGKELTQLVMEESVRLREEGADFIVYVLHDGYGESGSYDGIPGGRLRGYYDTELSAGYVDLVFEGHTHQRYLIRDSYGVYHLQNRGENRGISHVEVDINSASGSTYVTETDLFAPSEYVYLEDDPIVQTLLDKYSDRISIATEVLGESTRVWRGNELRQQVAQLYYEKGVEVWGGEYDIALGGGFISVRNPYDLSPGEVKYGILQSLFPFDNELVLCSIRGKDLRERFFENDHDSYFIAYGDYGADLKSRLDPDGTYYLVTDTYSSTYGPNKLTEVQRLDEKLYARDLLAEWIRQGGLNG